MNNYIIKFDNVSLDDTQLELTTELMFKIFEELIENKAEFQYEDENDYGFTLLFKQLEKNKEEYLESIKDISQKTSSDLESLFDESEKKTLKDLL